MRAKLAGEAFGDAGRTVVIEEGMTGPEVSVFALCDGVRAVALDPAQDFKRVGDGDTGPNTGGMGAYSPLPWLEPGFADDVIKRFVQPTLDELRRRGIDYRGAALHRPDGHRRGPEAGRVQHPLRRPRQPGGAAAPHDRSRRSSCTRRPPASCAPSRRSTPAPRCSWSRRPRATRPRCAPATRSKGLDAAAALDGVDVLCAGVADGPDGQLVTAGGRVLEVVGRGPDLPTARERAYAGVGLLDWPGAPPPNRHRHEQGERQ